MAGAKKSIRSGTESPCGKRRFLRFFRNFVLKHAPNVRIWKKPWFSPLIAHRRPTAFAKVLNNESWVERLGAESYLFGKSPFAITIDKAITLTVVVASKVAKTVFERLIREVPTSTNKTPTNPSQRETRPTAQYANHFCNRCSCFFESISTSRSRLSRSVRASLLSRSACEAFSITSLRLFVLHTAS